MAYDEERTQATGLSRLRSGTLAEATFQKMLRLERRRSDRSGRRFVLMLIEAGTPGAINEPDFKAPSCVSLFDQRYGHQRVVQR